MQRNWRQDKPTDRQIEAIKNMRAVLGEVGSIPATKGECSDLITKMKGTIQLVTKVNSTRHSPNNLDELQNSLDMGFDSLFK